MASTMAEHLSCVIDHEQSNRCPALGPRAAQLSVELNERRQPIFSLADITEITGLSPSTARSLVANTEARGIATRLKPGLCLRGIISRSGHASLVATVLAQDAAEQSTRRVARRYGFDGVLVSRSVLVKIHGRMASDAREPCRDFAGRRVIANCYSKSLILSLPNAWPALSASDRQ